MQASESVPERPSDLPLDVLRAGESRARGRRPLRVALPLVVLALAGGWFAWSVLGGRAEALPALLDDAGPRPVMALGRLEPRGEIVRVGAPTSAGGARIEEVRVAEGDWVEAGGTLAVLDTRATLAVAVDAAAAELERARARLELARVDVAARRAELEASRDAAQARLDLAEKRLARRRELLAGAATSQETVDDAQLEVRSAQAALAEVDARRVRYRPLGESQQAVDVLVAERDVDVAAAAHARAKAELARATVVAPVAGEVLDLAARPGESVAGGFVAELGDTRRMEARVEVYESDVASVHVGQEVHLHSRALDAPLVGRVRRIDSLVQRQSVTDALPAANTDARVVDVLVELDAPSSERAARFVSLEVRAELLP